jgi:hypothetical protein
MGTSDRLFRNGTPLAKAMVGRTGKLMMTNGALTGNFIQGNYPRFYVSSGKSYKISGLNTSEPVQVWNCTKLKCVNWNMVAAVGVVTALSVSGWAGVGMLIAHFIG